MNAINASSRTGQPPAPKISLPARLAAALLTLTLLPGLSQAAGQAPIKTGPGAPTFTLGDPAYQGISNAQANVSANAPAGAAGKLTAMVNQPPAIVWTTAANTVVTASASFALTVNASDPDGSIAKVDYYNGTALIGTATAAPYGFTWSGIVAGTYTLTAVATDNLGMSATTGAITVISNAPPSVNLTGPAANTVATAPASFSLSANANDSDGSIAKVDYYANNTLVGTTTAAPYTFDWTSVPAGSYTTTAVATDNYGASTASTSVTVISNAPPTVSITAPASNTVAAAPGSFNLTAYAVDVDGAIAKVEFYNGTTLIGTATSAPYSVTLANVTAGIYTLTAVATDNHGAATTSSPISVVSDTPPAVSLTAPYNNTVSVAPGSFTLTSSATSSMSTIAKVEYYQGSTLIGTATETPYTYAWDSVPAGTYAITAKATDGYGISNTSTPVTIISNAPPAISLTAPANNSSYTTPANITLAVDATDSDGAIARVEFYNGAALIGTATAAPYRFTWNNAPVGTYTITAVAADGFGTSATSAAVSITVKTGVAQVYYIHADHLDTPRVITDTAGNKVWEWQNSDPFGNNPPNQNPSGQGIFEFNKRFSGQYFDKETNTHYNYFRDYDPATGRYIQSDPIGLAGGSWSTYQYVNSNPLKYVDPSGLCPICPLIIPLLEIGLIANEVATSDVPIIGGGLAKVGAEAAETTCKVANNAGTETVQRWMSKAELEATQNTGLLRGGREGPHYVTDAANTDPLRARQRLALPQTPEVRVTLEVPKNVFSQPSRVEPLFDMPGGGMERIGTGNIPVQILEVR